MQQARNFSLGWLELAFVALVAILAAACGDDGGSTDAGSDAARTDAARADSGPGDAAGGGG